jgi:hypothetical protein
MKNGGGWQRKFEDPIARIGSVVGFPVSRGR